MFEHAIVSPFQRTPIRPGAEEQTTSASPPYLWRSLYSCPGTAKSPGHVWKMPWKWACWWGKHQKIYQKNTRWSDDGAVDFGVALGCQIQLSSARLHGRCKDHEMNIGTDDQVWDQNLWYSASFSKTSPVTISCLSTLKVQICCSSALLTVCTWLFLQIMNFPVPSVLFHQL